MIVDFSLLEIRAVKLVSVTCLYLKKHGTEFKFGIEGAKNKGDVPGDHSYDSGTILATYLMTFSLVNAWEMGSSVTVRKQLTNLYFK